MKFNFIKAISLMLVIVMLCFVNLPVNSLNDEITLNPQEQENSVISVSSNSFKGFDVNQVYVSRFLNMLNHNYVYGESFQFVESMINDSMPALLNLRESEEDSIISEEIVSDYMYNMYGIENIDYSSVNSNFERIEGYVYIVPRGYSLYNHEIAAVTTNEDGSFTVLTEVTVKPHDSVEYTDICETLFVKNEKSQFGFSIIRSNIGAASLAL